MIHEYPEYYTEFQCVGGACKDSCCISWELDIDDETYEYYKNVPGEFGDRLRHYMRNDEENTFILGDDGRCPFLNADNLCDIYTELGEASLCSVCTEFPRSHETIGGYTQSDIGMSCPEAARLIFERGRSISYVGHKDRYDTGDILDRKEKKRLKLLIDMRNILLEIISYGSECEKVTAWHEKAGHILKLTEEWQQYWVEEEYGKIKAAAKKNPAGRSLLLSKDIRLEMLGLINELELLDDTLVILADRYKELYDEAVWQRFIEDRGIVYDKWMENILSYYIFRYMIRAFDDNNIHTKAVMAVYSCTVIECMDYVRWLDNGHSFTAYDRIDIAHKYAKEVEHSEDNLEYLEEEFIFDKILTFDVQ